LIAAGWLDPNFLFAIVEVIVGLGFIIFVHELGHFAVAKVCGVKCEKFFVGFDIGGLKLWSYRYGETLYGIGVLPLGGYVKMLGQEDNPAKLREEIERAKLAEAAGTPLDQVHADSNGTASEAIEAAYDPRSYLAKSVPQRMAIISAGVIMNLIFAFVFATIAMLCGIRRESNVVGSVVPGSGAWQVGIQAGDKVVGIDGEEVQSFNEMLQAIVTSSNDKSIQVSVMRPGIKESIPFSIQSQSTHGRPTIGIHPCEDVRLRDEDDGLPFLPGTPAAAAQPGFAAEDRIVKVDDTPIENYTQLHRYLVEHADKPVVFVVERQDIRPNSAGNKDISARTNIAIRVEPRKLVTLGITMEMGEVAAVKDDSPAKLSGILPGDVLRKINGKAITDPMLLPIEMHALAGQEIAVTVQRQDKTVDLKAKPGPFSVDGDSLDSEAPITACELGVAYYVLNKVAAVDPEGPAAKSGLKPGDVLQKVTILPPPPEEMKALKAKYAQSNVPDRKQVSIEFDDKNRNWPITVAFAQALYPESSFELEWKQGTETKTATIKPGISKQAYCAERGLEYQILSTIQRASTLGKAVEGGWRETSNSTLAVYRSLRAFGSGKISVKHLHGPPTIVWAALYEAMKGPGNLLLFLTL
jgi:regulator of sigma E protease